MPEQEGPLYSGIRAYQDPGGRFMFRYPKDWHHFDLSDDRDGVMVSPYAENPSTWFSMWASALPDAVAAEDIDVLREGVNEGLARLNDLHVEFESEDLFGNMCRFERIYTFSENGETRKRRVWMIYVYRWLIVLMAQGKSPEDYQYWSVMFNFCIQSLDLAPELWYASDPELAAKRQESATS